MQRLTPLVHDRLEELGEAPGLLDFFFRDVEPEGGAATQEQPLLYDPALLMQKKMEREQTATALQAAFTALAALEIWSEGQIEEALRALAETLGLKAGQLFGTIRVATTGRGVAPPLFETLTALGRERSLARIASAAQALADLSECPSPPSPSPTPGRGESERPSPPYPCPDAGERGVGCPSPQQPALCATLVSHTGERGVRRHCAS